MVQQIWASQTGPHHLRTFLLIQMPMSQFKPPQTDPFLTPFTPAHCDCLDDCSDTLIPYHESATKPPPVLVLPSPVSLRNVCLIWLSSFAARRIIREQYRNAWDCFFLLRKDLPSKEHVRKESELSTVHECIDKVAEHLQLQRSQSTWQCHASFFLPCFFLVYPIKYVFCLAPPRSSVALR